LFFALSFCACTHHLKVTRAVPLKDASAVQPQKRAYASVMVLPPTGSERGAATALASLEKALLKRGVRVISSGVTGRVVVEETEAGAKTEGATGLSDLERALVLARKSNADALLQVSELEWVDSARWFVPKPGMSGLAEAESKEEFEAADSRRRVAITSPRLVFIGKIIDVESGEIVASIDLSRSVGDAAVPASYKESSREFNVDSSTVRMRVTTELMDRLAQIVSTGENRAPAAVAAQPETPAPPPSAPASAAPAPPSAAPTP
jgi:hypothetical protein